MKVELIEHTPEPDTLAAVAARSCRSEKNASKIRDEENKGKLKNILRKTVGRGHTSVIEHATFAFSIEGISRACSHQLVRHRIASYSQQSQRVVEMNKPKYVTPPSIEDDLVGGVEYDSFMRKAWGIYNDLIEGGVPEEDARFVLPNATKTNIVVTMNARSLLNFFELRTCMRAQWEIRNLANEMLAAVKEVAPTIFENAGPPCKRRGTCPDEKTDCPLYKKFIEGEQNKG